MSDRPIIFSAPMVRALRDGRKTQTRRLLRKSPAGDGWHCDRRNGEWWLVAREGVPSFPAQVRFAVGDRLWVKEAMHNPISGQTWKARWHYADGTPSPQLSTREKPGRLAAMHMCRRASRLTLFVNKVCVHRLQDISEADAIAEG